MKSYSVFKILALSILLTLGTIKVSLAQSNEYINQMPERGGSDGGGGATIRENGVIKTLPESIFFAPAMSAIIEKLESVGSKKYPSYYDVSPEQESAVDALLRKIDASFGFPYFTQIMGPRGTYIKAQVEGDASLIESIKADYQRVISGYNLVLPEELFSIVAYSKILKGKDNDVKTYIFYEEFDKIPKERQALIFFHEANMRNLLMKGIKSDRALDQALRIDAIFWNILQKGINGRNVTALYDEMKNIWKLDINNLLIVTLEKLVKRPLFLGELTLVNNYWGYINFDESTTLVADPSLIQQHFGQLIPGLADRWEQKSLLVERLDRIKRYYTESIKDSLRSLCANKNDYLKMASIRKDYAGPMIHFHKDSKSIVLFECHSDGSVAFDEDSFSVRFSHDFNR